MHNIYLKIILKCTKFQHSCNTCLFDISIIWSYYILYKLSLYCVLLGRVYAKFMLSPNCFCSKLVPKVFMSSSLNVVNLLQPHHQPSFVIYSPPPQLLKEHLLTFIFLPYYSITNCTFYLELYSVVFCLPQASVSVSLFCLFYSFYISKTSIPYLFDICFTHVLYLSIFFHFYIHPALEYSLHFTKCSFSHCSFLL